MRILNVPFYLRISKTTSTRKGIRIAVTIEQNEMVIESFGYSVVIKTVPFSYSQMKIRGGGRVFQGYMHRIRGYFFAYYGAKNSNKDMEDMNATTKY